MLPLGAVVWRLDGSLWAEADEVSQLYLRAALADAGVRPTEQALAEIPPLPADDAARAHLARARRRAPTAAEVARVVDDFTGRLADYFRSDPSFRVGRGATERLASLVAERRRVDLVSALPTAAHAAAVRRLRWEELLGSAPFGMDLYAPELPTRSSAAAC
jgi:hypothetical protein